MARTGGRSNWIAVPVGMICTGVVAALVWLSLPMFPVAVDWVGNTLRAASAPRPAPSTVASPAERAAASEPLDCRSLYPDTLWAELTWHGRILLTQTAGEPATSVPALTDALDPNARITCSWQIEGVSSIVTSLSAVPDHAADIADAALREQGFSCSTTDGALTCIRASRGILEEQFIRGGLWLSSIEKRWHPDDYGTRVAAQVWG